MERSNAAAAFGALAQETRIGLILLLAHAEGGELSAGRIARRLGLPPSTLSFHLTALTGKGLLKAARRGREVVYRLRPAGFRPVVQLLAAVSGDGPANALQPWLADEVEEERMTPTFNVLFICTRNSARSIMAECLLEAVGRSRFNAYSAGTEPAEAPMPEVIERLQRLGHDTSRLRSKSWREFLGPDAPRMDFLITLCDVPEGEICPDLGPRPITAAWPFPDPAKFTGSGVERLALLNGLYGMIRRRLEAFASLPFESLDGLAVKARLDELGEDHHSRRS
jgi:arsenate reductase